MSKMAVVVALVLAITGCGEKKTQQAADMPGMSGMQGMVMRSDSLIPRVRAHLDSLARLPGRFAAGMPAVHDAMTSQMLDAMGSDMRMMNMPGDTAWTALTDSVRRDLADLPGLAGRPLEVRVRAHIERLRRLLDTHERMMQMHR